VTGTAGARRFELHTRTRTGLGLVVGAGALVFLVGLFVAPGRVWGGFLIGFDYLVALALAGPVFLALLTLASARWSAALQRVPEAMASALPAAAALGVVLLFGIPNLYEWSHAAVVERDPLLQAKSGWLDPTAFGVRLVVVFAAWIGLARHLVARCRRFAEGGGVEQGVARLRSAALFMLVFVVTFSVASFDWIMSLEPHWFSTMFALLRFGGVATAGVAAAAILVLMAERQGALRGVLREEHLHDVGKLLFSFSLFWAYCWYCQYMLIWYTNIPEETSHYVLRKEGSWWLLVQTALVLKWAVPFVALLSRRACRSRVVVGRGAVVVLVGHAVDLYVHVGAPLMGSNPVFGLWEAGPIAASVALFFLVAGRALGRTRAVPERDPHLADSLSYHTP